MAHPEEMVRPGKGVPVEKIRITSTKEKLRTGTYTPDDKSRQVLRDTLTQAKDVPKKSIDELLVDTDRKDFRNAYASLIIEPSWTPYNEKAAEGVYQLEFDHTGKSTLIPFATEQFAHMRASDVATKIAASNQDVLMHYICEQFSNGKTPEISGDQEKDQEYFDAFKEQTDLDLAVASDFRTVPSSAGSPSVFVTSGSLVLRTHIFGLPNIIDALAHRDGIELSSDQHRNSFTRTMQGSIAHYYLPTTSVTLAINRQLIDPETLELKPEAWRHNGNPDDFMVYPDPQIVSAINAEMSKRNDLPAQTNCPAFHSKVESQDAPGNVVPLPRELPLLALKQLDQWYYPQRRKEVDALRPR